jgi:chromosomal replication initiation ATPase DnaA
MYQISKEDVLRGVRGRENEARKVAVSLVRRCCDQGLKETASLFGLGSYGAVEWDYHGMQAKMQNNKKFKDRIDGLADEISQ